MRHLKETKMTYLEHGVRALSFSVWSLKMFLACSIHAILPFLFTDTFSNEIKKLNSDFEKEKNES